MSRNEENVIIEREVSYQFRHEANMFDFAIIWHKVTYRLRSKIIQLYSVQY